MGLGGALQRPLRGVRLVCAMARGLSDAQLIERVERLEAQLRAVYERLGMAYDDGTGGVPKKVTCERCNGTGEVDE